MILLSELGGEILKTDSHSKQRYRENESVGSH